MIFDASVQASLVVSMGSGAFSPILPHYGSSERIGVEYAFPAGLLVRGSLAYLSVEPSLYTTTGIRYRSFAGFSAGLAAGYWLFSPEWGRLALSAGPALSLVLGPQSGLVSLFPSARVELSAIVGWAPGFALRAALPLELMFRGDGLSLALGLAFGVGIGQ